MKNQVYAYCTNCGDRLGEWSYFEESLPKPDWASRYDLTDLPDNSFRRSSFPNNRQCSRFGNCKDTPGVTLVIIPDIKEQRDELLAAVADAIHCLNWETGEVFHQEASRVLVAAHEKATKEEA